MAMTKGLVNQVIEIMGRNTDTFKEAVECYVDIKKEIEAIKNTQIDILKMINKMEQK